MLGAYYQLSSPVKFNKAWQVLTQIVDKMYTQNFQSFYYSLGLYWNSFSDETSSMASVLADTPDL